MYVVSGFRRTVGMNRRDFLLLRTDGAAHAAVLSCERLYMRYLDSQMDDTTGALFAHLSDELRTVKTLRLTDSSWLACGDLKDRLDAVLQGAGISGPGARGSVRLR
jgi:hypothetical protein